MPDYSTNVVRLIATSEPLNCSHLGHLRLRATSRECPMLWNPLLDKAAADQDREFEEFASAGLVEDQNILLFQSNFVLPIWSTCSNN